MTQELKPNKDKKLNIKVNDKEFSRWPIKTHVITKDDDIFDVVSKYAMSHLSPDDILFISERVVAITQGRAIPVKDIKASRLAKFLVKFVHKSPYGIGLGSDWTMELAIRETGRIRILLAAAAAAITKPFGIKGVFYKVAGNAINAIDGRLLD